MYIRLYVTTADSCLKLSGIFECVVIIYEVCLDLDGFSPLE